MKRLISICVALTAVLQLSAQKNELVYKSYTKDVAKQDTAITMVYCHKDKIAIENQMNLDGIQTIKGLAKETRFVDYDNQTFARQLEYEDGETFLAKTDFKTLDLKPVEENVEVGGFKCKKYTTSINSNSIEIWMTEDLDMNATPMIQFAGLKGVMVRFVRNGNSILELASVNKLRTKTKADCVPSHSAKEVTFKEMDNIEREKMVITTKIFEDERVHWGDTTKISGDIPLDSVVHFAGGTIVLKKVRLESLPEHYQIFAELTTKSSGDAYDRTGSVFIIPTEKEKSLYDALTKGIDVVPYFTSSKGAKYQAMCLTDDFMPVVELIRFFTPFGVGHFNDRLNIDGLEWEEDVFYKQEVTDLAKLLRGEVLVGVFIGNYDGGGHKVSLDLKAYPGDYVGGESKLENQWLLPIFNTCNVMEMAGQNYPHFFDTDSLTIEFDVPEGVKNIRLRYITTGHGGWGGGDEFNPKVNEVFIDGKKVLAYTPWRSDCARYREWNPVSGNFWNGVSSSDLSRSGWCPGTATQPVYVNLDGLTAGKHTLKVAIPQGQAEGGSFSAWSVSGVLIGEKE